MKAPSYIMYQGIMQIIQIAWRLNKAQGVCIFSVSRAVLLNPILACVGIARIAQ